MIGLARLTMKIPNARIAKVERQKITEYLLNSGHRYGAGKARFFARFGFTLDDWEILSLALCGHARQHEVSRITETVFGPRYEVEGELQTPDGRTPRIRTVWQLDRGMVAPRVIRLILLRTTYD